jgi:sugar phosphate permease
MTASGRSGSGDPRALHYGWVILAASTLTVLGCIGFARFGYTMILPSMQTALGLSNTQTGGLATANSLGYLALALVGGFIASRYGPRRVVAASMVLTGAAMALTGLVNSFCVALVWRAVAGAGSGGSNVPIMSLLSAWFGPRRRGLATGIAVGGSSLALVATGYLVPLILDAHRADGWRYSWFALGAAVGLLGLLGLALLRDRPGEKGLRPIGAEADNAPLLDQASSLDWGRVYRSGAVWRLALVYIAFGLSYIIYVTYFAKYLQDEAGYTKEAAGNLWALVGWASIFCGLIWGAVSDLIGRKYGLALVYLLQAVSYATFALWQSPAGYTASAVIFGLTAWSIPGIVAAACGDYVGARMAPAALGFVTLFFGLGQAAGPTVAGWLIDVTDSLGPALLLASGVSLLGGVGSLLMRPPRPSRRGASEA